MTGTDKDNKQNGHPSEWDRMLTYQLLQENMEKQKSPRKTSSSDGSTLIAILCTIGGFAAMCIIFSSLGVDAQGISAILLILLWFVFAIIILVVALCIGSRK